VAEERTVRRLGPGIAGIRFLIPRGLTLDAGVRYPEDFRGIADAGIDTGVPPVNMLNQTEVTP